MTHLKRTLIKFRVLKYFLLGVFVISDSLYAQISITAFPDNYVYIFEESRKDDMSNLIIHNIGILNTGDLVYNLEELSIAFYKRGNIFQQNRFTSNEIVGRSSMLYKLQ